MSLYSYKGAEPTRLPGSIYLDNGLLLTDLYSLSNSELAALGFTGPYVVPGLGAKQFAAWDVDSLSYVVFDLPASYESYKDKAVYNQETKTVDIVPLPEHEVASNYAKKFDEIRATREQLFTQADFAVSLTAEFLCEACQPEVDQYEELLTYKTQLRDLLDNVVNPFLVVFPTPPSKLERVLQGQYGPVFKVEPT